MLSGKAYSRATRGHLITAGALSAVLMLKIHDIEIDVDIDDDDFQEQFHNAMSNNHCLLTLANFLDDVLAEKVTCNNISFQEYMISVSLRLREFEELHKENMTLKLWLMYIEMISIVCKFIKAQRTGNWLLHLEAVSEMLPFFASSGHYLYAKSSYFYLQSMRKLKDTNPKVHEMFLNGHHVVRRSDSYWAGLSTDLVIEQELMRTLKATSGMTCGRGMSELQPAKFILSTPSCLEMKCALVSLTEIKFDTSDQHKALRPLRINRDYIDAIKIVKYLTERNPFDERTELLDIDLGEVAEKTVNVFDTKSIGHTILQTILQKMIGQSVFKYSYKRKDMAVTMKCKSSVEHNGEIIPIDNQLLIQRLSFVAARDHTKLKSALNYELTTLPASLFNKDGLMKSANKPALAEVIWKIAESYNPILPDNKKVFVGW